MFIAGGVTAEEAQVVHEINSKKLEGSGASIQNALERCGAHVVLGGSSLINSKMYSLPFPFASQDHRLR